jgi:hypothetical protein
MEWKQIKVSEDNTHFLFYEKLLFNKRFYEVLKFHEPGIAPVRDEQGAYHIDSNGQPLYAERYARTFGYYCNRAAVIHNDIWFHLNELGNRVYKGTYSWVGNYQETLCTVRNRQNQYFHIDLHGNRVYGDNYLYAGDFKDGIACVKMQNGRFKHIDREGQNINDKEFTSLGVFHKNFAIAKDSIGWYHIDKQGNELYGNRFTSVEPFYNGFALATQFDDRQIILNEKGSIVHMI